MTTVQYNRPSKIEIGSEAMEDTKRGYKSTTDMRGEIKVDPNVSLEDYSGPFKPDLRFTDFSREQLARMYLMSCEYGFLIMEAYQAHIFEKYGFDAMLDVLAVWENEQFLAKCMDMKRRWMNIEGKDIESYMKDFQTDFTALPGKYYDVTFEMPSKDRGIMTFNRCVAVDIAEGRDRRDVKQSVQGDMSSGYGSSCQNAQSGYCSKRAGNTSTKEQGRHLL